MKDEKGNELNEAKNTVPKLMIDKKSDFRFHAAYLAYSQAWDKADSQEIRTKLNELILSLSREEMEYESFYERKGQYMNEGPSFKRYVYARDVIRTQRKGEWRRREKKAGRNARHEGRR